MGKRAKVKQICYVCKQECLRHHFFYPELCQSCGEINFEKRKCTTDLEGYTALVTGGRLKIGFETALRLLRCGAKVVITSRFKADAQKRFSIQNDFDIWKDRLQIYAADFRVVSIIEDLIESLCNEIGTLDILINNAAQTIRRPPSFYRHLLWEDSQINLDQPAQSELPLKLNSLKALIDNKGANLTPIRTHIKPDPKAIAELSILPLIPGDELNDTTHFPTGQVDKDGQQEDRRDFNSWMMKLEDVHLIEFLEVMYINIVAPFLLCSQLKGIMKKKAGERPSFIINVSAMEGNFFDPEKNWRHPHTNMAKAAINMLTRTSALDFRQYGIYMNAVDPGWVTNERPFPLDVAKDERKTKMAIDEIDGASRVCDPIFRALNNNEYLSGLLLKNYLIYPW